MGLVNPAKETKKEFRLEILLNRGWVVFLEEKTHNGLKKASRGNRLGRIQKTQYEFSMMSKYSTFLGFCQG